MLKRNSPQAGVYRIVNIIDGKVYIGGTVNLSARRRNHFTCLRLGYHGNPRLQKAYNVYGRSAFRFEVIQNLDSDLEIKEAEQKSLDEYKASNPQYGYNIAPRSESTKGVPCPQNVKTSVSLSNSRRLQSDFARSMSRERITKLNKLRRKASDEMIAEMLLMRKSGCSMDKISVKFGFSPRYLGNYIFRLKKNTILEESTC